MKFPLRKVGCARRRADAGRMETTWPRRRILCLYFQEEHPQERARNIVGVGATYLARNTTIVCESEHL